jgi:hypothetical protein
VPRPNTADYGGGIGLTPATEEQYEMSKTQPKPILNVSLPKQFRQVRIALAREPGHPEGDADVAYVIVAPLDTEDRIDSKLWREHRDACRIVRQRPDEQDKHGHLVHRPGGGWAFHYDHEGGLSDEFGYHFADERFVVGEYVSISDHGKMHTYRVTSVSYI